MVEECVFLCLNSLNRWLCVRTSTFLPSLQGTFCLFLLTPLYVSFGDLLASNEFLFIFKLIIHFLSMVIFILMDNWTFIFHEFFLLLNITSKIVGSALSSTKILFVEVLAFKDSQGDYGLMEQCALLAIHSRYKTWTSVKSCVVMIHGWYKYCMPEPPTSWKCKTSLQELCLLSKQHI